ncbi:LuxR C-terminal-related transcriptional regulator [Legionella sp. CNM-4043-24]|uniref:LuxR C-terminal-related transcriptional regulator n=1 Tax=Legionella sp. CNM-4043-24 TaxID=3421646 RepID=UPI00403ABD6F
MKNSPLTGILEKRIIQLPGEVMLSLLSDNTPDFITIKNQSYAYEYVNQNHASLFGYKKNTEMFNRKDSDFCRDKSKVKIYTDLDDQVFDTGLPNVVCEEVYPERNKITRLVSGTLYPIMNESAKTIAVLGVFRLAHGLWQLNIDLLVSLSAQELDSLLVKRSYSIRAHNQDVSLSKREIQCLAGLLKGQHAGEIAGDLNLQQSTIESYLDHLKNKLGVFSKSALINTVFEQKIIQQLLL